MKTEEKYNIFAKTYVMNGFNGKDAAISAGYSAKTAEQQASRLLRNVKVLEFIDEEMKLLSKRMRDDASKIYAELWKQVRMIDEKIAKHEEASAKLSVTDARKITAKADINNLKAKIRRIEDKLKKLDGRKSDEGNLKKELLDEHGELKIQLEELEDSVSEIYEEVSASKRDLLWHKDWKEILSLRAQILQDLFDRSGYKETSELQDRRIALLDAQINKLNADEQDERTAKLKQIVASTENIQARTELIKGAKKDTSIMEALIDVVNGGDGSGSISVQPEATRDDQTDHE
ncbi:terminase [Listeria monocytogenes]|uniref:Terminase n=1 Tax=Listeria monocytogenes TaxID=1639 RepID=A0A9P2ANC3_LISMN|nr:terminase small subunit [Listeria monocytogenes]AEO26641.1 terminase [Listeria monocytogenes FSL R2-561]ATL55378.1 terminase [Listeria monocytogenes]EAC3274727.1 terminase [Listeria monocytogenes]EAC3526597.1 terminase [Listeria monocytogenes]EAC4733492.1 terminase [Listeria monocytogenes]